MSDTEDTKEHNDIEKPKTPSDTKDDTENQEVYYLLWKQFTSLNNLITYKRALWPFYQFYGNKSMVSAIILDSVLS